jgi:hypothetical protein
VSLAFLPYGQVAYAAGGARITAIKSVAPVGAPQILNAEPVDVVENPLQFRFRVRRDDEDFRMVRDFSPSGTLEWTSLEEGAFEVEATLRDSVTGQTSIATTWIEFESRVAGSGPLVSNSAHPLVMLYSAPPCDPSQGIRVTIWDSNGVEQTTTPPVPCKAGRSVNLYLGGLRGNTAYTARQSFVGDPDAEPGPLVEFTTGNVPEYLAGRIPPQQVAQGAPSTGGVLLQSTLPPGLPVAADLQGNVVWYYPSTLLITRPEAGGLFFGVNRDARDTSTSFMRLFDMGGNTVLETTAAAVNLQLAAQGKRQISTFHHEARFLPDGNILVMATIEQLLTGVQGDEELNVIGDMILVLNRQLEVLWTWDSFDHLDVRRKAVLDETCIRSGACDPYFLTPDGNDWTHGNAVSLTPDGGLLYSSRHQDWLIKINYANGEGDGSVLWRLGHDGDFAIDSEDPSPWFSHQHDATLFEDGLLIVFDNGNSRQNPEAGAPANSRGQVYRIDEATRKASLVVNKDLGAFAAAVGSSQRLPNGNFHFGAGWYPGYSAMSFELDPSGNVVYALRSGSWAYRTYRMPSLYGPFTEPK